MFRVVVVAVLLTVSASAREQQAGQTLGTCLADSTSGKDRKLLAKWIFLAIAAHPEMKQHTNDSYGVAADESSRLMAALLMRLLTESCLNETKAAIKMAGPQSLQNAFEGLGQLAMQELMADQSVKESIGLFERYVDQKHLLDALAGK